MKAYDSYKESGIQWLPKIPSHWDSSKIKSHFRLRSTKVSDQDFPPLSVSKNGVTPQLETAVKTDNGDNRKLVKAGDFVVNSRSDRKGACGVSSLDGSVSLINIVLEPIDGCAQYYHHLFRSNDYIEEFYRNGRGIVSDLWTTRWNEMSSIMIPFPPIEEQEKIVAYLDKQITLIESCKYQRERELQTLNELKQAEIASVVTHGLNPNVPMKDSGIPWIGQIPAHWETRALRNVSLEWIRGNGVTRDQVTEDGVACVRYGELYTEYNYSFDKAVSHTKAEFIPSAKYVMAGDILFAMTGEKMEEIGKSLAYTGKEECILGGDIMAMRHSQNPLYLSYVLSTPSAAWQKGKGRQKLKVLHTTLNNLRNVVIPLPPINEQNEIVNYIQSKVKQIDKMIDALKAEIDRFTEYKQRLVVDVVSGQINVQDETA